MSTLQLITDINHRRNLAGRGINVAQRIMDFADGNQILVGYSVYDRLRSREKYVGCFREFPDAKDKHGNKVPIYQFIASSDLGLNKDIPKKLEPPKKVEHKLSKIIAYYFAHAIQNESLFRQTTDEYSVLSIVILLWLLAYDSKNLEEAAETVTMPVVLTYKAGEANRLEQLKYYCRIRDNSETGRIWVALRTLIVEGYMRKYMEWFIDEHYFRFISTNGKEKLKAEYPEIWDNFDLDHLPSNYMTS